MEDADHEEASVRKWLEFEREQAFAGTDYGKMLRSTWQSLPNAFERVINNPQQQKLYKTLTASFKNYTSYLSKSLEGASDSLTIPGYHGLLERSLDLCKIAAKFATGETWEKVIVTTLPSNQRYAAVYQPHVAPSWRVIALDWGVICGMIGLGVCFAKCIPATGNAGASSFNFSERQLIRAARKPEITKLAAGFLPPAIQASNTPPIPLLIDGISPQQNLMAAMIINGLIFCVVAHEYGHIMRGHIEEAEVGEERRFQMEHEADTVALTLALANPWKHMTGVDEPSIPLITTGCLALVFSFLMMLDIGDSILADLGNVGVKPNRTHPDPLTRWEAIITALSCLPLPKKTKEFILRVQAPMFAFGESLWDAAVQSVHTTLAQNVASRTLSEMPNLKGATLKFV
jgi:hypothetical protein